MIVLTKEQQAAINDRGGPLLVSAAAGSGKTKVLVDRVLKFVAESEKNVDDFLMITFTQAAAAELCGKLIAQLSSLLAQNPNDRHLQRQMSRAFLAQISTVHAFCGKLLREYAHVLELPADFRVCDEQEAAAIREKAMRMVLDEAYTRFEQQPLLRAALDMLAAGRDDQKISELISKIYFSMQCDQDPNARLGALREMIDVSACTDAGQTVWGIYLIAEFQTYLSSSISQMQAAYRTALQSGCLDAYLPTLRENERTLEALRAQNSWDALQAQQPDFGKLTPIRKCPQPELQKQVQTLRKRVIEGVRTRMNKFSLPSREVLHDIKVSGEALSGLLLLVERFCECYRTEKLRRHVLDYNDLEHDALRLLVGKNGQPTAAAREIAERFEEIMVDEYQDTNAVQDAIFNAISRGRIFMVGDVKQSIYRFRLADPTIFLKKYAAFSDYTSAQAGQARKVLLSDNFRSHPEILSAANDVFRLTMTPRVGGLRYGDAEALRAKCSMPAQDAPAVELHCTNLENLPQQPPVRREEIEAEVIATRIAQMLQTGEKISEGDVLRPIAAEDIVILMRSLSGKAQIYMQALQRHGIQSVCGSDDIFAAEEIQFLSAFLQIIDNPHQDIPLVTVLTGIVFGFTAEDLAAIRAENRHGDFFDALRSCTLPKANDFLALLTSLRDLSQRVPLRSLLDEIDEKTLLRSVYGALPDGAQRSRNIDTFVSLADRDAEYSGLSDFLRRLTALRDRGIVTEDAGLAGAVRLMTVHKSKGLEFPVVVLADLAKGFNHTDARASLLVDTQLGIACNVYDTQKRVVYPTIARSAIADKLDHENISEEMRVLYVAMTRAKHRLIMSYCARRLTSKLTGIARELTNPATDALIESAQSQGDWVLMTAMTRSEAGELFALSEPPACSAVSEMPWKICVHDGAAYVPKKTSNPQNQPRKRSEEFLKPMFQFDYAHAAATNAPTKLTATQLKGRTLDDEVMENTVPKKAHFRKPNFVSATRPLTPAERGTAIHLAMQHLQFERCTSVPGIKQELLRLENQRFLTPEQLAAVQPEKLYRFFTSETGLLVRNAKQVVREFKFSILDDATYYERELESERVLLQGVTDCCIIDENGLTILDFKSDSIRAGGEAEAAQYYRGQIDAYSRALSRIFELPVCARILYFFATDTAVSI